MSDRSAASSDNPAEPPRSAALTRALAAHPDEIAQLMAELHRRVHDTDSRLDLMGRASREAVRMIVDARWAGVTARFTDQPFTAAHTDERVLLVDEGQYDEGDGPCLTAARTDQQISATLDEVRSRWPLVAEVAEAAGVRSFLAEPLHFQQLAVGSLNLYSDRDDGLRVPDSDLLTVLVEYLDRGLTDYSAAQPGEHESWLLKRALDRQQLTHQAVGVLMATYDLDADRALAMLDSETERRQIPIDVVAREIIAQHHGRSKER